ncbi:DUF2974 domain-containing protein [Pseudoalteromonas sp. R3]|uniref:lipase family protein n=1 Tax=Pseudoalteromonas sp. R3 TaxID=1709477 RepID=UPI0006B66995|nr:DUF2974 domain-containing protein [Pseudoalteromonas sp. R3]AZZ96012.1 DUF2974 domain-containing protein [Pseudoalteromonas sp. R3]
MKILVIVVTLAILFGCTTTSKNVTLVDCDHPSGWCEQIRNTAQEAFVFAQMSHNVYQDDFQFSLPTKYSAVEHSDNDAIGFAYSIYEDTDTNTVILVFRGTEDITDWWYGNFLGWQNESALELFDQQKSQYPEGTKFIVTGHSLGGAIALEISLKREHVDTYVFNTSPRFRFGEQVYENKRVSIVENGEILKLFRAPAPEATQTYTSLGCSSGGPLSQHEQSKLAVCLTKIAASQSAMAIESLNSNNIELPEYLLN